MMPGQWGQIRTRLCGDFCDTLITHSYSYAFSIQLFFVALVSCCRLLGLWDSWPVLCSPYHEKAFCFSSAKHSLMFIAEKTYDCHISGFNHFTLSRCPRRPDGLNRIAAFFTSIMHLLPWTTADALKPFDAISIFDCRIKGIQASPVCICCSFCGVFTILTYSWLMCTQ